MGDAYGDMASCLAFCAPDGEVDGAAGAVADFLSEELGGWIFLEGC